jgi:hypothetical protein
MLSQMGSISNSLEKMHQIVCSLYGAFSLLKSCFEILLGALLGVKTYSIEARTLSSTVFTSGDCIVTFRLADPLIS